MKWWHILIVVVFFLFVGFVWTAERSSMAQALSSIAIPVILTVIGVIVYWIVRIIRSPDSGGLSNVQQNGFMGAKRASISIDEAKFITAKHFLKHHGINLISTGNSKETARYNTNLIASRCFPSPGEEAWYVSFKIVDTKHFGGLETWVIVYLDGFGRVIAEPIMNTNTSIDMDLWRNPTLYFTRGVSKTSRPRSVEETIAKHIEETGEIPRDLYLNSGKNE